MPYVPQSNIRRAFGRIMSLAGEAMTLQRTGQSDLPVQAKRVKMPKRGGPDIVGSFAEDDFFFEIGHDELAAAGWGNPVRTDHIVDADGNAWAILHVETLRHGTETLAHTLIVSGG